VGKERQNKNTLCVQWVGSIGTFGLVVDLEESKTIGAVAAEGKRQNQQGSQGQRKDHAGMTALAWACKIIDWIQVVAGYKGYSAR
jgi:hypothetical protein